MDFITTAIGYYVGGIKRYVDFKGRARRQEYWMYILVNTILSIVFNVIAKVTHLPIIVTIFSLALLLPSIAVGVRRLHDVEKSGWFILIPFYNLYLLCMPGTKGANKYGEDPIK